MPKKQSKKTKKLVQPKKLHWKNVAIIVLLFALVGGVLVYVTNAGSNVTFARFAKEMTGGHKNQLYANGTRSITSPVLAVVTMKEFLQSRSLCTHYYVQVPGPANGLGFQVEILDSYGQPTPLKKQFSISGKPKGYSNNACMKTSTILDSGDTYAMDQAGTVKIKMVGRGGVLIDKIEGRR